MLNTFTQMFFTHQLNFVGNHAIKTFDDILGARLRLCVGIPNGAGIRGTPQ